MLLEILQKEGLSVRLYDAVHDYLDLRAWAKSKDFTYPTPDFLPSHGYVIEDQGIKLCAGFFYQTDSPIAWIEWIVRNPEADKDLSDKALDLLIETLISETKKLGFKARFTSSNLPKLIERYTKHGFSADPDTCTQLIHLG